MNARAWADWFRHNRTAYEEPDWNTVRCRLEGPGRRRLLARSLAIFQLGETGGGSRLKRFVRQQTTGEPFAEDYNDAVDRFIEEENYHAELLAHMVAHLGGELLQKQWTNSAFRGVRSLINLEFNIQVLLTAELIAEAWYGILGRYAGDPVIEDVCAKITRDEVKHIAFHEDFFRYRQRKWSPLRQKLWAAQFRAVHAVVLWVVWRDHGECLRSMGVSRRMFHDRASHCCRGFLRRVLRHSGVVRGRRTLLLEVRG